MYKLRNGTQGSKIELNAVFKETNELRNGKIKKSLEPGIVVHAFIPSTWEAEADRSVSLRPAWCTEQV